MPCDSLSCPSPACLPACCLLVVPAFVVWPRLERAHAGRRAAEPLNLIVILDDRFSPRVDPSLLIIYCTVSSTFLARPADHGARERCAHTRSVSTDRGALRGYRVGVLSSSGYSRRRSWPIPRAPAASTHALQEANVAAGLTVAASASSKSAATQSLQGALR